MLMREALLCMVIIGFWGITTMAGAQGDLRFFYERTTYLDHLNNPGDWWANPAQCALVESGQLFIGNVSPVGGRFTLAGARFISPVNELVYAGVGLSGTASFQSGSFNIETDNAQYKSDFAFFAPALQLAVAMKLANLGALGALLIVTTDHSPTIATTAIYTPSLGISIGYLTPRFADVLMLSASTYSLCHLTQTISWDHSLKCGVSIQSPDSILGCTIEAAAPVSQRDWLNYYVVNGLIAVRIYKGYGAILGLSTDQTKLLYSNDINIHIGAKAYSSPDWPYFGSYEVAINPALRILHRFTAGYNFGSQKK